MPPGFMSHIGSQRGALRVGDQVAHR